MGMDEVKALIDRAKKEHTERTSRLRVEAMTVFSKDTIDEEDIFPFLAYYFHGLYHEELDSIMEAVEREFNR